jgi:hypothetical protein
MIDQKKTREEESLSPFFNRKFTPRSENRWAQRKKPADRGKKKKQTNKIVKRKLKW